MDEIRALNIVLDRAKPKCSGDDPSYDEAYLIVCKIIEKIGAGEVDFDVALNFSEKVRERIGIFSPFFFSAEAVINYWKQAGFQSVLYQYSRDDICEKFEEIYMTTYGPREPDNVEYLTARALVEEAGFEWPEDEEGDMI